MTEQCRRITVLGAGNAGLTAAYHLSRHGSDVCLYGDKGFDEQLELIADKGGIEALAEYKDVPLAFAGFENIHTLTTDMAEAVSFSSVIVMPVPSFAQELLFKAMLPHLSDQHIIMLMPGNYGSLVLSKLKDELGYEDLSPTFVDAITIPWACRIAGDAEIAIMGIKEYLPLAALPASRTGEMIEALSAYFPLPLTAVDNVLAAGLENINFGGHPLLTTLNMGLLENFNGDFNYYKDCCSPATARAAAMMEQERIAVGEALGMALTPELEAMNGLYGLECESVYELNRTSETHGKITSAPDSSRHRYITEDVPYLLAPCHQLAQLGELPVPLISSCLHIAGAYNGVDYFTEGRSLEEMGLAEMSIEQIKAFVS